MDNSSFFDTILSDEEIMALKGGRVGKPPVGGGSGGGLPGGGFPGYSGMAPIAGFSGFEQSNLPIVLRKRGVIPGVTPGKPAPQDTVPAMLTPGEIVMNPGVTYNPEVANQLLALNQRGAYNMMNGLGPVGMEYGGQAGFAYGGMVPEGFGKGGLAGIGSWLKHNLTLKNYGKYVGLNALVAGAILGAPYLAAGAAAAGHGAAAGGAALGKGALAGGKFLVKGGKSFIGSAGKPASGGQAAVKGRGAIGWLQKHPGVAKSLGEQISSGGSGSDAPEAPLFAGGGWSGYSGTPVMSYTNPYESEVPESGGYAEGGVVPGMGGDVMGMMPQGGPAIQPGMEQGMEQPGMEGMDEGMDGGPEMHENPYPSSAVRILQLLLELDEAEQEEYGGGGMMGMEGHAFGGFAGLMGRRRGFGGLMGRLQQMRANRPPSLPGQPGVAGSAAAASMASKSPWLAGRMGNMNFRQMQGNLGQATPAPQQQAAPAQPATATPQPQTPQPGFAMGGEVPFPFDDAQGFKWGGRAFWGRFKFKGKKKTQIDPYGYGKQQAGDIAAARAAGVFDPRGNQALIRGMEEGARGTADALVRRNMSQAQLGGMDPAQQAVARQQALLQTGRGVQDIMATTRANALSGADQFFKNMYGGAAANAQQAQIQNDLAKRAEERKGFMGGLTGLAGTAVGGYMQGLGSRQASLPQ